MVNISGDRSPERARQDYVKVIYQLGLRKPVRAADLARRLGVSRASVSKFKRMLERERLLRPANQRTDTLRLTKKGMGLAIRMVRRHRLVETFLHKTLHVPLDRVHVEAEKIEHAISDDVSTRLATFLDHPSADPHGHRIPDRIPRQRAVAEVALVSVVPKQTVIVTSIDDRQATSVRRLAALGVLPGTRATVLARDGSGVRLLTRKRSISLSLGQAQAVQCKRLRARAKAA